MKIRLLISAIALSTVAVVPLSGCSTISTINTAVTTPLCAHTLADDKAYYGVLALYNVPAFAYKAADQNNVPGWATIKPQVKPILQKMRTYVVGAKAAYGVCNTAVLGNYKAQLQILHDQVLPLIPKV